MIYFHYGDSFTRILLVYSRGFSKRNPEGGVGKLSAPFSLTRGSWYGEKGDFGERVCRHLKMVRWKAKIWGIDII